MTLQRYWIGNDEGIGFPESDDEGEWVKASEAEAEIAALRKRVSELEELLTLAGVKQWEPQQ